MLSGGVCDAWRATDRVPARRDERAARLPRVRRPVRILARVVLPALLTLAVASVSFASSRTPVAGSPAAERVPAPAEPLPAPRAIPVPEVARQAEDVGKLLRDFEALVAPSPTAEAAERRLPEIAARTSAQAAETRQAVDVGPVAATLDSLTAQWHATRRELEQYVSVLGGRATLIEEAIGRLTALRDTWTRTRTDAQASRVPAPVIGRIDGVLAAIASSRKRLEDRRAAILVLQDRAAREVALCDSMLGALAEARRGVTGRLLERDSEPLWNAQELARGITDLPERIRYAIAADAAQLRQFASDQRWRIPVQVALFAGLMALFRAARRRSGGWTSPDRATPSSALVLERPVSASLLLTILLSFWLYTPPLPRSAIAVMAILALAPALRIVRPLLGRQLAPQVVPQLSVLGLFFLADLVRHLTSVVPVLERQIFLLEMVAAASVLAWRIWRRRETSAGVGEGPGAARALGVAAVATVLVFVAAIVAGVAGYMQLALLLGAGVLGNGYLAVVLYAAARVADVLVMFGLRETPARRLAMVRHHGGLLEERSHLLLRWLAIGAWAVFALRYFGLWTTAVSAVETALEATLRRGALSISLGDVLVFALTVGAAFAVSALLRFLLAEEVFPRLRLGRGTPQVYAGVLHYGLLLASVLLGLAALGVDLTKITILAGAFGVGIGFGLQGMVNNVVSGAIILFERRINLGDAVQIGDVAGQLQQMGMRACTVRTWEGAEVIVPNASLTSDKVVNWTLSDPVRRIDVAVGVAYGTVPERVLDILFGVARAHPRVLTHPAPVALFRGFGDSALLFELRAWTDRFELWVQTQSELSVALYAALREAGVEIPFPQREVRLRQG